MNAINVICPYWMTSANTWVFDDERFDLIHEPFVNGVPELIDSIVSIIPNARDGFRLFFSDSPFPNYTVKLDFSREEYGGWWYSLGSMEGWLCAAAQHYFNGPPAEIFIKVEPLG